MFDDKQILLLTKHLHNKLWGETGKSYALRYTYDYELDKHIFMAASLSFLHSGICKNDYREIILTDEEIAYILL